MAYAVIKFRKPIVLGIQCQKSPSIKRFFVICHLNDYVHIHYKTVITDLCSSWHSGSIHSQTLQPKDK